MKARVFLLSALIVALCGCSTVRRWTGAIYEVKGTIRDATAGRPVANVTVEVRGLFFHYFALLTPPKLPDEWVSLATVKTDSRGQFSCVVPLHSAYRFRAAEARADLIIDRKKIPKEGVVVSASGEE